MEWYYILGIVSYSIFIIQFLLTFVGASDLDIDIDLDSDADFSVGDLISFKGLTHFCMGLSGWLMINHTDSFFILITGIAVGIAFMLLLAIVYTMCYQLKYEPSNPYGEKLVGQSVAISAKLKGNLYLGYLNTPIYTELRCRSSEPLELGDIREIKSFNNGLYFI